MPPQPRKAFARTKPTRRAKDTVLIVCEGARSEPNYFGELVRDLGLSSADIRIFGQECGSDPVSVVRYAIEEYRKTPGGFDDVFCVIDRDAHPKFNEAQVLIKTIKRADDETAMLAWSDPCFEYWVLLHFAYSARPYTAEGSASRCATCLRELSRHLPNYAKGATGLYRTLKPKTDLAIRHAQQRLRASDGDGATNPSTRVHLVVERLMQIAQGSDHSR